MSYFKQNEILGFHFVIEELVAVHYCLCWSQGEINVTRNYVIILYKVSGIA